MCVCRKYQFGRSRSVDRYGVEKEGTRDSDVQPLLHCGYVTLSVCVYSAEQCCTLRAYLICQLGSVAPE